MQPVPRPALSRNPYGPAQAHTASIGLADCSTSAFSKPVPATSEPTASQYYQLLRNYMIGDRLAATLGLPLHLMVVKALNSPHFAETRIELQRFDSAMTRAPEFYAVACWNDFRRTATPDVLSDYASELPPLT